MMIIDWFSYGLIILGAFFTLTGAVGIVRMPDFFNRLHPAGLKDSMGIPLVTFGLMLQADSALIAIKLLFLMLFLLFTNPTSSHALAKSAVLNVTDEKKGNGHRQSAVAASTSKRRKS